MGDVITIGIELANSVFQIHGVDATGALIVRRQLRRRQVLDHIVVLGEQHLRHVLLSYMTSYNEARTHQSLNKDAPIPREVQGVGRIFAKPHLGGLHHQYVRI
jgi:hypothetical protein